MLTQEGCRKRQARLLAAMDAAGIGSVVFSDNREIYYLTGLLLNPAGAAATMPALFYIDITGDSWLASHTRDGEALAGDRIAYEPTLLYTLNPDLQRRLNEVVDQKLAKGRRPDLIGYQAESLPKSLADVIAKRISPGIWVPVDDLIAGMERTKGADEVVLLREAAACVLAGYDAARTAITPGANELEVMAAGHRAATLQGGEIIFHNGDYQSGNFGGFARNRAIEDGELYIIDGWALRRGYWADLCRTFAVGDMTPLQREIHTHVAEILAGVPAQIEVGKQSSELWRWIDAQLRQHPHLRQTGLVHHGGHGVGLRAHEAPDINRDRGAPFAVGDVVSVEPGAYSDELRRGVRIENTFLVTEQGVELLSNYLLGW